MRDAHDPDIDASISRVEEEFARLFNRVRHSMRNRADRIHPSLSPVGYKVLSIVVRSGSAQAGQLAEQLMTDKSIISRSVKQLEELGLVTRASDDHDRRAVLIAATEEGRSRLEQVRAADQEMLYRRLREWKTSDIDRFSTLLARLNEDVPLLDTPRDADSPEVS